MGVGALSGRRHLSTARSTSSSTARIGSSCRPALGFASRGAAAEPSQHGEFGLTARWSPAWLDGTLGFYYRNFADKLPQVLLTKVGPASVSQYNLIYADNIQLFGASIAKNIGGVSTSAEISYRKNTPLNAQVLGVALGLPGQGDTKGPRGDTWHGLVNAIGTIAKTPLFDAATWAAELAWSHLATVTSGANLFNGVGYAPCVGKDKWDGCATQQLRRHRRLVQPDLVPGPAGSRPVGADDLRDRPERQRCDDLRRQPGRSATTASASAPTCCRSTAST